MELLSEEEESLCFMRFSDKVLFSGILVLFGGVAVISSVGVGAGGVYMCVVGAGCGVGAGIITVNAVKAVMAGGSAGVTVVTGDDAEAVMIIKFLDWVYFCVCMK